MYGRSTESPLLQSMNLEPTIIELGFSAYEELYFDLIVVLQIEPDNGYQTKHLKMMLPSRVLLTPNKELKFHRFSPSRW